MAPKDRIHMIDDALEESCNVHLNVFTNSNYSPLPSYGSFVGELQQDPSRH